jgi:nitrogen regulatory protein P-II 1
VLSNQGNWLSSSGLLADLDSRSWESGMKRIEAVITPSTLDLFKTAARRLGISEFELVEVYRLGCETIEGGKGIHGGCEYRTDLSPRLRVEFVMFDDDVQATLHQLLKLVHPESISVFRLDQEVRTISPANHSKASLSSGREISTPETTTLVRAIGLNSRQDTKPRAISAAYQVPIRH